MYILENPESFNLKHIFECGQCFRWNYLQEEDKYIGVIGDVVLAVKEEKQIIADRENVKYIFTSNIKHKKELETLIKSYFNLNLEYNLIKEKLLEQNSINILGQKSIEDERLLEHNIALKEAIDFGYGIRILKQDLWETVVSYILSANNNIPRIKKNIETLAERFGRKIVFENRNYYSFPTPEELSKASLQDLRDCGLGFRDKRIYDITRVFLREKKSFLDYSKSTIFLKNALMEYNGIGPKVADCIILFSLNRYEIFPIDVWVRRVMNNIYFKKSDEKKLTNDEIIKFIDKKYGEYAGIAQQYLFYWEREKNGKY